jgi:hypothetical protein
VPHLDECGARDRYDAEEHEYRDLAQAHVPVRARSSRVAPGAEDTANAYRDEPPRRQGGQGEPGGAGHGEARERGEHDLPRRGQSRPDEPHRSHPLADGIGIPDSVAVVVGVVNSDLHRERDDQRERAAPGREAAVAGRDPGADHDRDDGGGQGARSRARYPLTRGRHLRLAHARPASRGQARRVTRGAFASAALLVREDGHATSLFHVGVRMAQSDPFHRRYFRQNSRPKSSPAQQPRTAVTGRPPARICSAPRSDVILRLPRY